jgi:hypothetical protein
MRTRLLSFVLGLALAAPALAASPLDKLPNAKKLFKDRAKVHALVVALEQEPLHKNAELIRGLLLVHYKEDVDYIICGDVLGPLAQDKKVAPVMFQIVIASGDWVEANPQQAKDIDAYTLAGLESGVRTYRHLLEKDPTAKNDLLEGLAKQFDANTLSAWNKAHPCRPD